MTIYTHAITGLMLREVYGQVSGARAKEINQTIEQCPQSPREEQHRRKAAADKGDCWRYLGVNPGQPSPGLSITSWQIMFMRSAKNAGFKVLQSYVDETVDYVRRCFEPRTGMFHYALAGGGGFGASRGVAGAGILPLSMAGQHHTRMAQADREWLLANPSPFWSDYWEL